MTVGTEHSRKRLTVAAKQIKDVQEGEFVRLRGHRGVGTVAEIANAWARIAWKSGEKSGEITEHPLASLRLVRAVGHDYDARKR